MEDQEFRHLPSDKQDSLANVFFKPETVGSSDLERLGINFGDGIQIIPRIIMVSILLIIKPLSIDVLVSFIDRHAPLRWAFGVVKVEKPCLIV